jgi:hypothetical protein
VGLSLQLLLPFAGGLTMMSMRARWANAAIAAISIMALSACVSNQERISQFEQFAEAGSAYSESVDELLDASLATAIDADNQTLVMFRDLNQDEDEHLEKLEEHDVLTKDRLAILNQIRAQLTVLRDYFLSLGILASRDDGSAVSEATSGIADASKKQVEKLGGVSEKIGKAKIGGKSVSAFVEKPVSLVVSGYQSAALDSVIEATAEPVNRSLAVHGAALEAIRAQIETDLEFLVEKERTDKVALPYMRNANLPKNWGELRVELLMRQEEIVELDRAVAASNKLQLAFQALVEKRADGQSFESLLRDLNELVDLAGALDG